MRLLYFLRVFVFSLEMLVILGGILINDYFPALIQRFADAMVINENLVNYVMLAPLGLAVWIFLEIRNLLQEDAKTANILTGWDGYWKLKTHTTVTIIYATMFVFTSLIPWCTEFTLAGRVGFLLFIISLTGQLIVALSIYNARIRLKEVIAILL